MQVTLFKALNSINIDDATATLVVEQLENFMKTKMEESTKGLEAQLKAQTWLIGSIGSSSPLPR